MNKDCEVRINRYRGRDVVVMDRSSCKEIVPLPSSTYEYTMHLKMLFDCWKGQKEKEKGKEKKEKENQYGHPVQRFPQFLARENIFQVAVVQLVVSKPSTYAI